MKVPSIQKAGPATVCRLFFWILILWSVSRADALTAIDDSAATLPNTPIVIAVLSNDFVSSSNATAILRVTRPAHGRVVINSTPASHAELTPLFQFAAKQLSNTVAQVAHANQYPWYQANGSWLVRSVDDNDWTSGFFPGALWMIYEYTGDTNYSAWAGKWMAAIAMEQFSTNTDDVGFMLNTSFGNGYRLTGNPYYKAVLLQGAQSLSNRFSSIAGCFGTSISPWPDCETIVDTMLNLALLYDAHSLDGDTNLLNMAVTHAGTCMTNHLRPDGSTYQRVVYDSTDGAIVFRDNRYIPIQPLDTWARGQAWGTYGFTMAFRETGDSRFLDSARQVANFYITNAPPDFVPCWYYPSNSSNTNLPRDSSAASITLSGLLDLSRQVTTAVDGAKYWLAAHNLFVSLSSTNYLDVGSTNAILLHGNLGDANTDTPLIYGDYYFIESLKRLNDVFNQTALTYIPDENFNGTDTFTCQVCDSGGATSTAKVKVAVGFIAQLRLSSATAQPVISFPTAAGKTYFIQCADNPGLQNSWMLLATNIPGSGAVISIPDTNPPSTRFYRVGTMAQITDCQTPP